MELRSGRRYAPPPPPTQHGPGRRVRSKRGADLISALPDDVLLEVLARLGRRSGAAALTCQLSRRWRGLWTGLHTVTLGDVTLPPAGLPAIAIERLHIQNLLNSEIIVHSASLRELRVGSSSASCIDVSGPALQQLAMELTAGVPMSRIAIAGPVLEQLSLYVGAADSKMIASLSAPELQNLSWFCCYGCTKSGLGGPWRLCDLDLVTADREDELPRVHVLSLEIYDIQGLFLNQILADYLPRAASSHEEITLPQEIEKLLQVKEFSVLQLKFCIAWGHVVGAFIMRILGLHRIRAATKRLELSLVRPEVTRDCPVNCSCDEPMDWRTQIISLPNLTEMEITGFEGVEDEFDVLTLILGCAPMLKSVVVNLSKEASPSEDSCMKKIYNIFKACPSIECSVYLKSGELSRFEVWARILFFNL